MPKHDPPGDDAALLELERELMELDRAIRVADENREAINYALFDRRDELMASIFNTPAAGLEGLAVQARAYLSEHEVEFAEGEGEPTSRGWAPCWRMVSSPWRPYGRAGMMTDDTGPAPGMGAAPAPPDKAQQL
jgi:hypothetical protein